MIFKFTLTLFRTHYQPIFFFLLYSFLIIHPQCVTFLLIDDCGVRLHRYFIFHLSRIGLQWWEAKQGIPNVSISSNTFLLLFLDPESLPGQMWYIIPQQVLSLPLKTSKVKLQDWKQMPESPFHVVKQRLYSEATHFKHVFDIITCTLL